MVENINILDPELSDESIRDNITLRDSCNKLSKVNNSFIETTSLNQETGSAGESFIKGIDLEEDHIVIKRKKHKLKEEVCLLVKLFSQNRMQHQEK